MSAGGGVLLGDNGGARWYPLVKGRDPSSVVIVYEKRRLRFQGPFMSLASVGCCTEIIGRDNRMKGGEMEMEKWVQWNGQRQMEDGDSCLYLLSKSVPLCRWKFPKTQS